MNNALKPAVFILVASGAATIWGAQYRQNHPFEGAANMIFGGVSQTYETAGWAIGLGILGFLVGIGVLIAGLVKSSGPVEQQGPLVDALYHPHYDLPNPSAASFDRTKWNALIKYDKDVAMLAERLAPLGQKWLDECASSYLALNDKQYLPEIEQRIVAAAKAEAEGNEQERLRLQKYTKVFDVTNRPNVCPLCQLPSLEPNGPHMVQCQKCKSGFRFGQEPWPSMVVEPQKAPATAFAERDAQTLQATPARMFCSSCGTAVGDAGGVFCTECGVKL
jgi:ribosomal protein L37AE/L43A